jgi:hypothetical protein
MSDYIELKKFSFFVVGENCLSARCVGLSRGIISGKG